MTLEKPDRPGIEALIGASPLQEDPERIFPGLGHLARWPEDTLRDQGGGRLGARTGRFKQILRQLKGDHPALLRVRGQHEVGCLDRLSGEDFFRDLTVERQLQIDPRRALAAEACLSLRQEGA